jgi:RNA-binding protein
MQKKYFVTINDVRKLRTRAHPLKPVVIIGQGGLTSGVMDEINLALDHHELIKVRVNASDRSNRVELINQIMAETNATPIQQIGHIATIYRKRQT